MSGLLDFSDKWDAENLYTDVIVKNVYDGDTITVDIPSYPSIIGKSIGVRIAGIDTPEIRTLNPDEKKAGYRAKEVLCDFLYGRGNSCRTEVKLRNMKRDKYFRILADVYVNGASAADYMVVGGYAVVYWGGTKKPWFKSK